MNTTEAEVLNRIIQKTQSDLILFFVIIVVAMVVVLLPLYGLISKDRKVKLQHENDRHSRYIEREAQIIQVVTANTEVMASLKNTLEANGISMSKSLDRIHERMDGNMKSGEKLAADMEHIKIMQEKTGENVQRLLLLVGGASQTGKGGI